MGKMVNEKIQQRFTIPFREKFKEGTLILLLVLFLTACGYSVKPPEESLRSLTIKKVQNYTTEPNLAPLLKKVLTEEALLYGIEVVKSSPLSITVVFRRFSLTTLSIKDEYSAEYGVSIVADVVIKSPKGTTELKGLETEYMHSFRAPQSITLIQAQKEIVMEEAMRDLARRIINKIIFRIDES